jgi:hypothetical protein
MGAGAMGTIKVAMPERTASAIWASASVGSFESTTDCRGRPTVAMAPLTVLATESVHAPTLIASRRLRNISRIATLGV